MYKIYQVEYGDTIDIIARKTGSTSDIIKNINGFNNDSDLVVGSLIIVPNQGNGIFKIYKIKQGDSIYSIARLNNVDPDTLLLLNGLSKNEYIYPNQEIMIPNSDVEIYVTKQGDTIESIINNLGTDANTFNKENGKLFVLEDQLVIRKKS